MIFTVWVVFHVIVSLLLVIVVLMQSAKGEGLAGTAFSGGMSGAVFGGRGAATFLSRATTVLAILFMFNCGALAFMSARTRTVASPEEISDSAVTRQATQEYEESMRRQQEAEQAAADSAATVEGQAVDLDELMNQSAPDTSASEPAGN